MGVGSCHTPAAQPPGNTRYLLYRRLGGPQGQSAQVQKTLPPLGFDPQAIQPIVSCYTNYAIPAPTNRSEKKELPLPGRK